LSLDLNEEIEAASLMSFGRDLQIRSPADRKPREANVVLRRGSTRRWAEKDSERVSIGEWGARTSDFIILLL